MTLQAERCRRGHFMAAEDDYAHEGYVEGYVMVCRAKVCAEEDRAAEARYWEEFDIEAFRRAMDDPSIARFGLCRGEER